MQIYDYKMYKKNTNTNLLASLGQVNSQYCPNVSNTDSINLLSGASDTIAKSGIL